jgi:hypothetical protein
VLRSAELFDPGTGLFSRVDDMKVERIHTTSTLLPDGRVLVVGGASQDQVLDSAELFDPSTGKFQATGPLAGPRSGHSAVALPDGRVAILGGGGKSLVGWPDDRSQSLRRVEIYDPAKGTFVPQGELAVARGLAAAVLLPDGKILIAGGSQYDPQHGTDILPESRRSPLLSPRPVCSPRRSHSRTAEFCWRADGTRCHPRRRPSKRRSCTIRRQGRSPPPSRWLLRMHRELQSAFRTAEP